MNTTPNVDVCPESLGAMLEYLYVERGPLYKELSPLFILTFQIIWNDTVFINPDMPFQ